MGPSPRGRRVPVAWLAGPQTPRSVEPLAAVCLEETRASEASWRLSFVSASGKPNATSPSRMPFPNSGEFSTIFAPFCASPEFFAEFSAIRSSWTVRARCARNCSRAYFPLSHQLLRISLLFCSFLFDEQIIFPRRTSCENHGTQSQISCAVNTTTTHQRKTTVPEGSPWCASRGGLPLLLVILSVSMFACLGATGRHRQSSIPIEYTLSLIHI